MKHEIEERTDRWMAYESGLFDFIIKTTEMIFAKTLKNIDSLREGQASRMRELSSATGSRVVIVGEKTSSERLEEGVVYRRYGLDAVSPQTFFSLMDGDFPLEMRKRGGKYRIIDPEKLRARRVELGLTQSKLAEIAGTTKKTIYMHERKEIAAESELVSRIESVLGKVSKPARFSRHEKPSSRRSRVDAGLFDIVAVDEFPVYIKQYPTQKQITYLVEFSRKMDEKTLIVTGKKTDVPLPSMTPEEFRQMELKKMMNLF